MMLSNNNPAVDLLRQYCQAYKERDLNTILAIFTENCHLWGSALDEDRVGLKALKIQHERDWSQSDENEIRILSWIGVPKEALFAAALCEAHITIKGTQYIFENLRGTIGVAKEAGMWKIAHMHASFPDMRNEANHSFPTL